MARLMEVVFATRDGEATLPLMLAAMSRIAPPGHPWRLHAVDNGSRDGSVALLQAWAARLPLTIHRHDQPGKLAALRSVLPRLKGDLVVFTDDDVLPDPGWLAAYAEAADGAPQAGLFGGPIEPEPLGAVQPWYFVSRRFHNELFARLAVEDGPQDRPEFYGPNLMLRDRHLDLFAAISPDLGPAGRGSGRSRFGMGEDTALVDAAQARGISAWGVAGARVRHLVRPWQTELPAMLSRARRHGQGWAIREFADRPLHPRRALVAAAGLAAAASAWSQRLPSASDAPSARRFLRLWVDNWRLGAAGAFVEQLAPPPEQAARGSRR